MVEEVINYTRIFVAGYLCLFGIMSFIADRHKLFFALTAIFTAIVIFPLSDLSHFIIGAVTLAIWPSLFLFFQFSKTRTLSPFLLFHYTLAIAWLIINIASDAYKVLFETVYYAQLAAYLVAIAFISHRLKLSAKGYALYLLQWIHFGSIGLLLVRLAFPIIGLEDMYPTFHLLTAWYLVGMTYHFIKSQLQTINLSELVSETGTNYEDEAKRRLEQALEIEKAYLIPDPTLQELSQKMHMQSSELSTFFNTSLGKNFNDVINEYRISEVQRLMRDPKTDPKSTIMELAYRAGFNSKATFNRMFKQVTGTTPKEYKNSTQ